MNYDDEAILDTELLFTIDRIPSLARIISRRLS